MPRHFGKSGFAASLFVGVWLAECGPLALARPARATAAAETTKNTPVAITVTDKVQQPTSSRGPELILRGTLRPAPSGTVGVTVKGIPQVIPGIDGIAGFVEGNQFVVSVPLGPSAATATLVAQDFGGVLATVAIPVPAAQDTHAPTRELRATRPGGLVPLTTGFTYSNSVRAVHVRLDADGDGTVDADETTLEALQFTYRQPGLYLPRLMLTDADGNVSTTVSVVHAADRDAMDARILPVWRGVKDALRAGDIAAACRFVHSETRAQYEEVWKQLPAAKLADIDQIMTQISLVEVGPGGAQYEMRRDKNGQSYSFAVWFQLDQDGLWRLLRF